MPRLTGPRGGAAPAAAPVGRIVEGFDAAALGRIADPGVALAIWRREPAAAFRDWIDGLAPADLPSARFAAPAAHVAEALAAVCAVLPDDPARALLADDAAALALIFAEATRAERLRVRFERVETDSCRRFHVDRVAARLICAYRGPGTEYGRAGPDGGAEDVRRLGRGHVAIFRGALWPVPGMPVHRSPPIAGTGAVRLLLVVDVEDDDL